MLNSWHNEVKILLTNSVPLSDNITLGIVKGQRVDVKDGECHE